MADPRRQASAPVIGAPGAKTGGADRDRTDDPLLAKQVLSQLSYSPEGGLVGLDGFEPSTPALSRRCSNQLLSLIHI